MSSDPQQTTIQQLTDEINQLKLENQQLKSNHIYQQASVYIVYHKGKVLYVGKDMSIIQGRIKQHMACRKVMVQNYQYIDIFLASIPEDEISFEIQPVNYNDCLELETKLINDLNPPFNQRSKPFCELICKQCQQLFKYRGAYETHIKKCNNLVQ